MTMGMPSTRASLAPGIVAALREMSLRFPDRIAHRSPTGEISYRDLWGAAGSLCTTLRAGGGGPVILYGHKESAMLVGLLGTLCAGRPYVPIDIAAPGMRILRQAEIASADTILCAQPLPEAVRSALADRGVQILGIPTTGHSPAQLDDFATMDRLAYIIFTSGSTGDPKGVPITLGALTHFVGWMTAQQRLHLGAEVILNQAPFSFDLSVMDIYLSLSTGGTLHSVTSQQIAQPRELFPSLYAAGLTVWVSTPSFARFCLQEPTFRQQALPALKRLLFCGEPLPPGIAAELLRRFPGAELWNTYGPTETTVAVTSVQLGPQDIHPPEPLAVGRPAPGMRLWICGDDRQPLPPGSAGEIVIAGPQVSPGYRRAPEHSTDPSGFGPMPHPDGNGEIYAYRTGDCGFLRDGLLYCSGRLDRQIKLHGYRIELDEIEGHLRSLPHVQDAVVLLTSDRRGSAYLLAFVAIPGAGQQPSEDFAQADACRRHLAEHLPRWCIPQAFRFLDRMPMTTNGKVDRTTLEGWAP